MYCVKEFNKNGSFIGESWYRDLEEALYLREKIKASNRNIIIDVVEISFSDLGKIQEKYIDDQGNYIE